MKKNRLIYGLLLALSLLGISFFGGAVSYTFFFVMAMIPIVSFSYLLLAFFLFHLYQKVETNRLVAKTPCPFYFTLVNDFFFVFAGIRVKFFSDYSEIVGLDETTEYEFLPHTGKTLQTNLVCKYRGEYEVGIKKVVVQDYFRLFSLTYKNREPLRVSVRPELVRLSTLSDYDLRNNSQSIGSSKSEPDILSRRYTEGDDIRQVNWKLSAKSGELLVRNKTSESKRGIGILMSTCRVSEKPFEHLPIEEKVLEVELALSYYFCEKNIPVAELHMDDKPNYSFLNSLYQFEEHYERISLISFSNEYSDEQLFKEASVSQHIMQCKAVYIVTTRVALELLELINLLLLNGMSVVVYLISDTKEELEKVEMSGVKVVRIGTQDDLKEVM